MDFVFNRTAEGRVIKCLTVVDDATQTVALRLDDERRSHRASAPRAAWILYCNPVTDAGTEFHWQQHHEAAERGKLVIFPTSPSTFIAVE